MLVLRGCRKRSTSPGAVFGVRPITSRLGAAHCIQRARHAQSPAPHGIGINHSPGHVRMAEQFLDTPDIGIGRQKMGSEAVPKRMAGHSRGQPGRSCGFFHGLLNHGLMDMVAAHDARARVLRRPAGKRTAGVARARRWEIFGSASRAGRRYQTLRRDSFRADAQPGQAVWTGFPSSLLGACPNVNAANKLGRLLHGIPCSCHKKAINPLYRRKPSFLGYSTHISTSQVSSHSRESES